MFLSIFTLSFTIHATAQSNLVSGKYVGVNNDTGKRCTLHLTLSDDTKSSFAHISPDRTPILIAYFRDTGSRRNVCDGVSCYSGFYDNERGLERYIRVDLNKNGYIESVFMEKSYYKANNIAGPRKTTRCSDFKKAPVK